MLKGIDPVLGPELLAILRGMGHGDEIAVVDGNYPAETDAKRLVRMDGHDAPRIAHPYQPDNCHPQWRFHHHGPWCAISPGGQAPTGGQCL